MEQDGGGPVDVRGADAPADAPEARASMAHIRQSSLVTALAFRLKRSGFHVKTGFQIEIF